MENQTDKNDEEIMKLAIEFIEKRTFQISGLRPLGDYLRDKKKEDKSNGPQST